MLEGIGGGEDHTWRETLGALVEAGAACGAAGVTREDILTG